jgi:hypothetical protein
MSSGPKPYVTVTMLLTTLVDGMYAGQGAAKAKH